MLISERKVEGEESVTTPAGTWNCFKTSYKCKIGVKTGPINKVIARLAERRGLST